MLNIEILKKMLPIINLSQLTKDAGFSRTQIDMKLLRNSELKVNESVKLEQVLNDYGLYLKPPV